MMNTFFNCRPFNVISWRSNIIVNFKRGEKMKKNICIIIALLFLAAGCSSVQEKESLTQPPAKEIVKEEVAAVKATQGTRVLRILPPSYSGGGTVDVKLSVAPLKGTSGIILEETPPPGWIITSATPPWMKNEKGVYKWLIFEKELKDFEIIYRLNVPAGEKGKKEFRGIVVTFKEKSLPIEGDIFIEEK